MEQFSSELENEVEGHSARRTENHVEHFAWRFTSWTKIAKYNLGQS